MEKEAKPVPMPRKTKYPFQNMKKGDEFELDTHTPESALAVRNAAYQYALRNKLTWKFQVKLYTDLKYRCKRIK